MFLKNNIMVATLAAIIFLGCSKSNDDNGGTNNGITATNLSVGASAKEMLTATKPNLVIEISYMTGYKLQDASVNNLVSFFQTYLNKPGGIQVIQKEIAASANATLDLTQIRAIEAANRTVQNTGSQVAIHILVTNGGYTTTANVIGVAYNNTSIALFGRTIFTNSGGIGQVSRIKLETATLNHEAAHLLGLVNIGTPLTVAHEDGAHKGHCNNSACLMYYITNTTDMMGALMTGNIPGLDANCHNDLIANGGK